MVKKNNDGSTKLGAKARKAEREREEKARVAKAIEDASWEERDKKVLQKLKRKEEDERKKHEAEERRKELKAAYDKEMEILAAKTQASQKKVTQHQLFLEKQRREEALKKDEEEKAKARINVTVQSTEIEENLNRVVLDDSWASNTDQALTVLSGSATPTGTKMVQKTTYAEFESRRLPELKIAKPKMTLSQLKNAVRKEWMRSPENPYNANAAIKPSN
uniref:Coiled-coil domain-containing protein n=1 Tax=Strongyloides venezuelensis TaxID=75913 RepID=A0A0K0G275_STRVS